MKNVGLVLKCATRLVRSRKFPGLSSANCRRKNKIAFKNKRRGKFLRQFLFPTNLSVPAFDFELRERMRERSASGGGFFVGNFFREAGFVALAGFLGFSFVNVFPANRHVR